MTNGGIDQQVFLGLVQATFFGNEVPCEERDRTGGREAHTEEWKLRPGVRESHPGEGMPFDGSE
jgi:hypothetical protein